MKAAGISVLLFFLLSECFACPVKPVRRQMTLADGGRVELSARGDEHFSFFTDDSGKAYNINGQGVVVEQALSYLPQRRMQQGQSALGSATKRFGIPVLQRDMVFPVVLVCSDKFTLYSLAGYDSPEAFYQDLFNGDGSSRALAYFKGYGSVSRYWEDNSLGRFRPRFEIFSISSSQMPKPLSYYGKDGSNGLHDSRKLELFEDIAGIISSSLSGRGLSMTGSAYSSLIVLVPGMGQDTSLEPDDIWSSAFVQNSPYDCGPVSFYTMCVIGECTSVPTPDLGAVCHEFGHCLGLPDVYDTNYGKSDYRYPGSLSLMDSGCYKDRSMVPPYLTCVERALFFPQWGEDVTSSLFKPFSDVSFPEISTGRYVRLESPYKENEYIFVEWRTNDGWDKNLTMYRNMFAIYHVDMRPDPLPELGGLTPEQVWGRTSVNSFGAHPLYYCLQKNSAEQASYSPLDWSGRSFGYCLSGISLKERPSWLTVLGDGAVPSEKDCLRAVLRIVDAQDGSLLAGFAVDDCSSFDEPEPGFYTVEFFPDRQTPKFNHYGYYDVALDSEEVNSALPRRVLFLTLFSSSRMDGAELTDGIVLLPAEDGLFSLQMHNTDSYSVEVNGIALGQVTDPFRLDDGLNRIVFRLSDGTRIVTFYYSNPQIL